MKTIKRNWEINENWQLVFPFLGIISLLLCGYFVSSKWIPTITSSPDYPYISVAVASVITAYLIYLICIWLFRKLEPRWEVTFRWELIAIFIVFAITGSASARLSAPVMELVGLDRELLSGWIYWPIRLLIIFPFYQVTLIVIGWIFGQFDFFWKFEKKMLARFGLKL